LPAFVLSSSEEGAGDEKYLEESKIFLIDKKTEGNKECDFDEMRQSLPCRE
jgi:hypothetical protein